MSDIAKRRFWQIHLSTAVVLMIIASGLLWANTRNRQPEPTYYWDQYGWPWIALRISPTKYYDWRETEIKANIGITLLSIGLTLFVCEYPIRRREVRKP